jgi:endonuclease G, mitochondrial
MNPILTPAEVNSLVDALLNSPVDTSMVRHLLFQHVSRSLTGLLMGGLPPALQLRSDINRLNEVRRLTSGEIPLQIYLQNAADLLGPTEQAEVIKALLAEVNIRTSGTPRIDPATLPELKEALTHQTDDTVSIAFMVAGARVGASVMKLRVPRFDNGVPKQTANGPVRHLGTGWLLTNSLLMTNHHVVNARDDGEPNASEADLRLQGQGTLLVPDFDSDGVAENPPIAAIGLEAWHPTLDYALLRIPPFADRAPLRRAAQAIAKNEAVNIIQHPGGRAKRYGIRNNLVSAVTDSEVRYFTDTERGSSGSPALNDRWEVVALHRASAYVTGVQYLGKPTATINLGTPIAAILADLQARFPALVAELTA